MKIMHIYKTYFPETVGGCEQVIRSLARQTTQLGVENHLVTLARVKQVTVTKEEGLTVHRFPMTVNMASCPFGSTLFFQYRKLIQDADILHYHYPWPFADFLHVSRWINKPTVVSYQSDIVKQKFLKIAYKPWMNAFLKRVDRIIPSSQKYLDSSLDLKPYTTKCTPIPNGIDEQDYPAVSSERLAHWRQQVGENFLLFVGVFRYYKGIDYVLDAIKNTGVCLVIAGAGPLDVHLRARVENEKIAEAKFVGRISEEDKVALLQLCSGVVLPSHLRSEAFGICLTEGLMFGKPLISTEIATGTSFVNAHQETGLVVPPANPEALKFAMRELTQNTALAKQMGLAARQRFENLFTAQQMAKAYWQVYTEILG